MRSTREKQEGGRQSGTDSDEHKKKEQNGNVPDEGKDRRAGKVPLEVVVHRAGDIEDDLTVCAQQA